ncbi:MAG: phosphatase PAP2 family protein, partial [Cyclobacteriaceae bacterium]|nr:phosphatase PAP2 family protein [Cyclobacteriaceae bacterium]
YASKNKYISALSFILALTVGFSRVYLLQHFFVDIYFGAILGVIATVMAVITANKILSYNGLDSLYEKSIMKK